MNARIRLLPRYPYEPECTHCGPEQCQRSTCRYSLLADNPSSPETCALDVASRGDHTLSEVGALFGVSRERIRQIEDSALRKLASDQVPAPAKKVKLTGDERRALAPRLKRCVACCRELVTVDEFHKHDETTDGYLSRCKSCRSQVTRKQREAGAWKR